jgi:ATP-dependent DNA ligase
MPLARLPESFDHPDWIFEMKYDGFRALAYVEHGLHPSLITEGRPMQVV